jgi:hypothetical protein
VEQSDTAKGCCNGVEVVGFALLYPPYGNTSINNKKRTRFNRVRFFILFVDGSLSS